MPTLSETIQQMNSVKMPEVKNRVALSLEASSLSRKHSEKFILASIDLMKIPLLAVGDPEGPLVVDINASGLCKTKGGFVPKIIIMSGSDKVRESKRAEKLICQAWVGEKVLRNKTFSILAAGEVIPASILENAPWGDKAIIQEKLLDKPNNGLVQGDWPGPSVGGFDVRNYGAPSSELNNPMLRLMLNVEEALAMYKKETADGVHKVVYLPYAEVPAGLINAAKEARIAASDAGLDLSMFSVMDFLKWQHKKCSIKASEQRKIVGKESLSASAFAYIGDDHDVTTWHGRIDTPEAAAISLVEIKASHNVPRDVKKDVIALLQIKAGGPGSGKHAFSVGKMHISRSADTKGNITNTVANKCTVCGETKGHPNHEGMGVVKAAGGPHLGKGKSAKKHLDEIRTKKVKAVGPPMTQNISSNKKKK